jgi:hypothetical protein
LERGAFGLTSRHSRNVTRPRTIFEPPAHRKFGFRLKEEARHGLTVDEFSPQRPGLGSNRLAYPFAAACTKIGSQSRMCLRISSIASLVNYILSRESA